MSGPKISVYSLTGRPRAIVDGQIRCELLSLACHTRTQEIIRALQTSNINYDQQIKNIELLIKRTSNGSDQIRELHAFQNELNEETAEIRQELAAFPPHISAKYRITEDALEEKQTELKRLQALQKRAEQLKAKLEEVIERDKKNLSRIQESIIQDLEGEAPDRSETPDLHYLQRDDSHNFQKIQASILDDLTSVSSFEFMEVPDESLQEKKNAVHEKLSALLSDSSLSDSILSDIQNAIVSLQNIKDEQYLKTFCSVTVKGLFRKADTYKLEEEQKKAQFFELYDRYRALCSMAEEKAAQMTYSEEAMTAVSSEIERLELLLIRQQEQAYISDCVDEVLQEMGYDMIGSREVRKKSGKRFRNELYSFNDGTAVNVTYSSDGQISMELGGLAREDRIPTREETEILTHEMENFCGEFAEFEQHMRAKGVILGNRIAMSPPSAEYAAIINVNDYDIAESTQISVMNAVEKRRKQSEKQALRKEE